MNTSTPGVLGAVSLPANGEEERNYRKCPQLDDRGTEAGSEKTRSTLFEERLKKDGLRRTGILDVHPETGSVKFHGTKYTGPREISLHQFGA